MSLLNNAFSSLGSGLSNFAARQMISDEPEQRPLINRPPVSATEMPSEPASTSPSLAALVKAFYAQESGSGANTTTSVTGARGGMQIEPGTFARYARPGESIDNKADNLAVGERILADLWKRSGGDPARVAVGYFSGPGNMAPPNSPTPWIKDHADPTGKTVSSYVSDLMRRIGTPDT